MYKEKILEDSYEKPDSVHQPEFNVIIERLQSALNRYNDVLYGTKLKLQMIKKYEEPSSTNIENVREKHPESVTEEFDHLLYIFDNLNEKAEINFRHLNEIV